MAQITIICDQTDCTFNITYAPLGIQKKCTHPHPAIQRFYPKTTRVESQIDIKTICNSKAKNTADLPAIPLTCVECGRIGTKACDDCLNIPPKI